MWCFTCGGPAHPSTGCAYNESVLVCGPCTRRFWEWFRRQQHRRWGGADFYAAVAKTIEMRATRSLGEPLLDKQVQAGSIPASRTEPG